MNKRNLLVTFLLALTVRLGTCWPSLLHPEAAWCPDATGYHELAAALWQGRFPSLFRTPGYPLFLALTGATSSNRVVVAVLVQMLLDALTAVLLMAIARRLFEKDAVAVLTGLFYAFCPVMAGLCGFIVSEPLAIFFVSAALFVTLQYRSSVSAFAQAACWFAATMVRPSYALLPLLASTFFLFQSRLAVTLKRQALALSLYAALTGTWIGFNYARAALPTLSSNPEVSFYVYDTAAVRMAERMSMSGYFRLALLNPPEFDRQLELHQISYAVEEQTTWHPPARDLWFTKDDPALIRAFRAEALQKMQGRLPLLIGIHATGALQSLRPRWNSVGWFFRILDALRMLLLVMGVSALLWQRQWWFLAFFGVWAAYALLPPGPVGAWRFRSLIEPFISLTLAAGLVIVAQWIRQQAIGTLLNLEASLGERPQSKVVSN